MSMTKNGSKNTLLKDFYQIKVIQRPMSSRPDLWVKNIITNESPNERVSTFVNLTDKYLMLWGGRNKLKDDENREEGFWLYSISDISWIWVKLKQPI